MKQDNSRWKATVLLFSGRENPGWELSETQQRAWMMLWNEAELTSDAPMQSSRLGYNGCRLQYDEHSHWQLYNGCVSFYEKETAVSKKDENRKLEFFLLNSAPAEVKKLLKELKLI